jgi:hypothetical protein
MLLHDIFPKARVLAEPPRPADHELREVAAQASSAIQQLQAKVGKDRREAAEISFPRGYLLEISRWRFALQFVRSSLVRNGVADTLMMHDVQGWVLYRTDLAGHARDMLVKSAIGVLGSIAEALLIDATSPPMGQRQKFASRVQRLKDEGVLQEAAAIDLTWLWEIRNRQHLHALTAREFDVYTSKDHPRAEGTLAALIVALQSRAVAPAA